MRFAVLLAVYLHFKKQGEAAATLFTGKHSEMTARMLGETGHDRAGLYCMANNVYQSFSGVSLSDGEKITATKTQRSHAVIFNQIVAFVAVAVEWMSDEELNRFLTKRIKKGFGASNKRPSDRPHM